MEEHIDFTDQEQEYFLSSNEENSPKNEKEREGDAQVSTSLEEVLDDHSAKQSDDTAEAFAEEKNNNENDAPKKSKTVPHGAFHEEREERKKAQAELAQLKAHLAQLNKNLQEGEFQEVKGESAPETSIPDPEKDPVAFMSYLAQQQKNLQEKMEEYHALEEKKQQEQHIDRYLQDSIAHIQKDKPDFYDATRYLYEMRSNQLEALKEAYPDFADQKNIDAQIAREIEEIIQSAAKNGTSPAQILYNFAEQAGYKSTKDTQNKEDMHHLLERQNSSKTLTASNGKNSIEPYSLEAITSMSDKDFSLWIAQPKNEQIFNKLMGY